MTFLQKLKKAGYPVAYHHFKTDVKIPFIVYSSLASDNFGADDKVYLAHQNYSVSLYTNKKDLVAEKKLEAILDEWYWEKSEDIYIDSEELFMVTYTVNT